MATVGTLVVNLVASTRGFHQEMDKSARKIDTFNRHIQNASHRMDHFASEVGRAARTATIALTAIVGAGTLVMKTAAGFERGMVRVKAVSQATAEEFRELEKAALSYAGSTEYTALQVTEGMNFMAMAGFKANQIIAAMPSVLQLATSGMMDLGTAADITTNILTGYGMEVEELSGINDILVSAMTGANVDLRQLGAAFRYVGPVAKAAGVEIETTAAIIALMGNAGIQGTMAGTSLRGAISRLLNPTGEAKRIISKLGLTVFDSSGKMRDMIDIVADLEKVGITAAESMALFGQRAGPAMTALIEMGSDSLAEFAQRLKESGGLAERIERQQLNTLSGQLNILKSQFQEAAIILGKDLMPYVRTLVSIAQDLVRGLQGMDKEQRAQIIRWAAMVAAILGGVIAFGLIVKGVALAVKAIALFGGVVSFITSPLILKLGLLAAGAYLLYAAWTEGWEGIVKKLQSAWGFIEPILQSLWDWLKKSWTWTIKTTINIADAISFEIRNIRKSLEPVKEMIHKWSADAFKDLDLEEAFRRGLEGEITGLPPWARDLLELSKSMGELIGEGILLTFDLGEILVKAILGAVNRVVAAALNLGAEIAGGIVRGIKEYREEKGPSFWSFDLSGIGERFKGTLDWWKGRMQEGAVLSGTTGPDQFLAMLAPGEAVVPSRAVQGGWPAVLEWFREMGVPGFQGGKAPAIGGNMGTDLAAVGNWLEGMSDTFNTIFRAVKDAFVSFFTWLGNFLIGLAETYFPEQTEAIREFIANMRDKIKEYTELLNLEDAKSVGEAAEETAAILPEPSLWERFKEGLQAVSDSLAETAVQRMPVAADITQGFQEGGIMGVFTALLTHSKAFATLLEMINPILQILADIAGAILLPALKLLEGPLKLVTAVLRWVAETIVNIWNAIVDILDRIIFFADLSGWKITLEDMTDEFGKAGDAASKLTESLLGVPQGFKVAMARFESIVEEQLAEPVVDVTPVVETEPVGPINKGNISTGPSHVTIDTSSLTSAQTGGEVTKTGLVNVHAGEVITPAGGAGNVFHITVYASDPEDFWRKLKIIARRENVILGGTMASRAPQYVGGIK